MDTNKNYETLKSEGLVRLRYPLEDWIEHLLNQYPEELASIRPEIEAKRAQRLYEMQRSLKERARDQLFRNG